MKDLITFLADADQSPPDFISQMIEENVCGQSARQFPNSIDAAAREYLYKLKTEHYKHDF
jgi:hypothetical protein